MYQAIWGSGADDVYAVGDGGTLEHSTSDGSWTLQSTDTNATLTGVWGSGPTDIYVSVNANVILHSTGDGMWEHQVLDPGLVVHDVLGFGPANVYALVGAGAMRSIGDGSWESAGSVNQPVVGQALGGSSASDLFIATSFANTPTIYRSTGDGTWRGQTGSPMMTVKDIWGTGPDHIYVTARDSVFFSRGDGVWTSELTLPDDYPQAVWAASREAVYMCTDNGFFYRSNGSGAWSTPQEIDTSATLERCLCIWGTGPDNIYVGTTGGIYHGTD